MTKNTLRTLLAPILAFAACSVFADDGAIPFLKTAPAIDGAVAATEWDAALRIPLVRMDGAEAVNPTEVWIGHDADNLYLAFKCQEKDMKSVKNQWRNPEERDSSVWTDDCVEILVDPFNNTGDSLRHIIINTSGVIYDELGIAKAWNSSLSSAVRLGDGSWTVEAKIPFSDFGCTPKGPEVWNFNLARSKASPAELSGLRTGNAKSLRNLNLFKAFHFATPDGAKPPFLIESLGGGLLPQAKISFAPDGGRKYRVEAGTLDAKGTASPTQKVECAAGETAGVPYRRLPDDTAILLKVFESGEQGRLIYENTVNLVNVTASKALAARTENPLYHELLGDEPAGLAKHGSITWVHGLVESYMRPFALQYGVRYGGDEMYKMFAKENLFVLLEGAFNPKNIYFRRGSENGLKFVVQPDCKPVMPQIHRRHPFLLDPKAQDEYMESIRNMGPQKDRIFAIFWGDETMDVMEKHAVSLFHGQKDSYEFIRKADAEIKERYGCGKYGMPESEFDPNPYRWIAFRHWMNDTLVNFYKKAYKEVKSLYPDVYVMSDDPTARQCMVYSYDDMAGTCDIFTHQLYPQLNPDIECFGFITKYIRDLSGTKEVWPVMHVEEYACSYSPEDVLEKISESVRCGATGCHWFLNDTINLRTGRKYTHFEYYGAPDRWQVEMGAAKELAKMNRLRFPEPDCAIFAPVSTLRATIGVQSIPKRALCLHSNIAKGAEAWYKFINEGTVSAEKDLSRYKVIMTADAKYVDAEAAKRLRSYVEDGGTLLILDPEAFSLTPSGESLDAFRLEVLGIERTAPKPECRQISLGSGKLRAIGLATFSLQPAASAKILGSFPDGSPAVIENKSGKGKAITFAVNPCDMKLAGNAGWKDFIAGFLAGNGVKLKQDIWRFKLPNSIIQPLPEPEGLCLTGNYAKWRQFNPEVSKNVLTGGTYTCKPAPDKPRDAAPGKDGATPFDQGHLTDRLRAIFGGNADLGKSKLSQWVAGWDAPGRIEITFDLKKPYKIDRAVVFHQGFMRNAVMGVSMDGASWTETKFPVSASENTTIEDVREKTLRLPKPAEGRFVRVVFEPPAAASQTKLTIGEMEIWSANGE